MSVSNLGFLLTVYSLTIFLLGLKSVVRNQVRCPSIISGMKSWNHLWICLTFFPIAAVKTKALVIKLKTFFFVHSDR